MDVTFRKYTAQAGITADYHKVRAFFIRLGHDLFEYTRWDWMATHGYLDKTAVGRIGLWERAGEIVGVATFDTRPGRAYCLTLPGYAALKETMLRYALENLGAGDGLTVVIADGDLAFQDIAAAMGFIASEEKEMESIFYLDRTATAYRLPQGFRITSLKDTFDLYQYRRVLWKGFDHELKGEGELEFGQEDALSARAEMLRPHVDLDLKVAVVAPDGNFVSYCGMWYDPQAGFAVVEPVATDPAYRRMGLGKAAVLEGIRRVGQRGATKALVGSGQQFYYSIGFRPSSTATVWKLADSGDK